MEENVKRTTGQCGTLCLTLVTCRVAHLYFSHFISELSIRHLCLFIDIANQTNSMQDACNMNSVNGLALHEFSWLSGYSARPVFERSWVRFPSRIETFSLFNPTEMLIRKHLSKQYIASVFIQNQQTIKSIRRRNVNRIQLFWEMLQ